MILACEKRWVRKLSLIYITIRKFAYLMLRCVAEIPTHRIALPLLRLILDRNEIVDALPWRLNHVL